VIAALRARELAETLARVVALTCGDNAGVAKPRWHPGWGSPSWVQRSAGAKPHCGRA